MKGIYRADATNHTFISSDVVADDYQLQANETFENPTGKLEPSKLVNGSWIDATPEEHEAYLKQQQAEFLAKHPVMPQATEPDQGTRALNLLGQQLAQVQAQQVKMASSINTLGKLIANAKAQDTKEQA